MVLIPADRHQLRVFHDDETRDDPRSDQTVSLDGHRPGALEMLTSTVV